MFCAVRNRRRMFGSGAALAPATDAASCVSTDRLALGADGFLLRRAGQNAQYFLFAHDDEVFAIDLDLSAGVLAEQDAIAFLDCEREHLAFFVALALAHGDNLALLRLIFCRVGDDDAAASGFRFLDATDQDPVVEGGELGSHSELTPFGMSNVFSGLDSVCWPCRTGLLALRPNEC